MDNELWWKTTLADGIVDDILAMSVDMRKWYLKIDLMVRLKQYIMYNNDYQDIVNLWKRLNIIKKDFGEKAGSLIIQEAVRKIHEEFNDPEWTKVIQEKLNLSRAIIKNDSIKIE